MMLRVLGLIVLLVSLDIGASPLLIGQCQDCRLTSCALDSVLRIEQEVKKLVTTSKSDIQSYVARLNDVQASHAYLKHSGVIVVPSEHVNLEVNYVRWLSLLSIALSQTRVLILLEKQKQADDTLYLRVKDVLPDITNSGVTTADATTNTNHKQVYDTFAIGHLLEKYRTATNQDIKDKERVLRTALEKFGANYELYSKGMIDSLFDHDSMRLKVVIDAIYETTDRLHGQLLETRSLLDSLKRVVDSLKIPDGDTERFPARVYIGSSTTHMYCGLSLCPVSIDDNNLRLGGFAAAWTDGTVSAAFRFEGDISDFIGVGLMGGGVLSSVGDFAGMFGVEVIMARRVGIHTLFNPLNQNKFSIGVSLGIR